MNRPLQCGLLTAAIWGLAPDVAHAYVDPGSAGFIITAVLGFLAAVGYVVRGYLGRLKRWIFRGGRKNREDEISGTEDDADGDARTRR